MVEVSSSKSQPASRQGNVFLLLLFTKRKSLLANCALIRGSRVTLHSRTLLLFGRRLAKKTPHTARNDEKLPHITRLYGSIKFN